MKKTDKEIIEAMTFIKEQHNGELPYQFGTFECAKMMAKYLKQQLPIPRIVSSFFTASDVGKEFKIMANTSGHGFNIGEIVTLMETNADPDDDKYKFAGKDDYWWCNFADIKTKQKYYLQRTV